MYKNRKNADRSIASDTSDQTKKSSSSSRLSEFSHYSENHAAAGDFKEERGAVVVKYTEHTARTVIDDTHNLGKEELIKKIKDVVDGISNQERYIKHQEEKQRRNKQLIDHLTSLTENERKDIEYKKQECAKLEQERRRYEKVIQDYRKEVSSSSARYVMAQRLNDDLVKQKRTLEKRRDFLRRKEEEMGIDGDRINELTDTKRLLEAEQEKKQNLMKRIEWYESQIAKIKNKDSKHKDSKHGDSTELIIGFEPLKLKEGEMREDYTPEDNVNIFSKKINPDPGLGTKVTETTASLPNIAKDVCVVGKKVEIEYGLVKETCTPEVNTILHNISKKNDIVKNNRKEKVRQAICNTTAKASMTQPRMSKSTCTDKKNKKSAIYTSNQTDNTVKAEVRPNETSESHKNIVPKPPTAPRTQDGTVRRLSRKFRPRQ